MANISTTHIFGLGWLGLPLAFSLKSRGIKVTGSVSSEAKQAVLNQVIPTRVFNLYNPMSNRVIDDFANAALVLNIPPGRKAFNPDRYSQAMIAFIDNAMQAGLQKLIFVSTTSVFNGVKGHIHNYTSAQPTTESGKAHVAIEHHLQQQYPEQAYIVRPSGLVGPIINHAGQKTGYRHPVYSLSKKQNIANGHQAINLVHQADVIAVIEALICTQAKQHVFNLAAFDHPIKSDYYAKCAELLNLPAPGFLPVASQNNNQGKIIVGEDTFRDLQLTPHFGSTMSLIKPLVDK